VKETNWNSEVGMRKWESGSGTLEYGSRNVECGTGVSRELRIAGYAASIRQPLKNTNKKKILFYFSTKGVYHYVKAS